MTEQTRPIWCHYFRVTPGPCMEPATVEVLGPEYTLLCEEHARDRLAENMPERWEQSSPLEYARDCEEAASKMHWLMADASTGSVLYEILSEAETYFEEVELPRARATLVAEGGTPRITASEAEMLTYFCESAKRFGWTGAPPWVATLEGYEGAALVSKLASLLKYAFIPTKEGSWQA